MLFSLFLIPPPPHSLVCFDVGRPETWGPPAHSSEPDGPRVWLAGDRAGFTALRVLGGGSPRATPCYPGLGGEERGRRAAGALSPRAARRRPRHAHLGLILGGCQGRRAAGGQEKEQTLSPHSLLSPPPPHPTPQSHGDRMRMNFQSQHRGERKGAGRRAPGPEGHPGQLWGGRCGPRGRRRRREAGVGGRGGSHFKGSFLPIMLCGDVDKWIQDGVESNDR